MAKDFFSDSFALVLRLKISRNALRIVLATAGLKMPTHHAQTRAIGPQAILFGRNIRPPALLMLLSLLLPHAGNQHRGTAIIPALFLVAFLGLGPWTGNHQIRHDFTPLKLEETNERNTP